MDSTDSVNTLLTRFELNYLQVCIILLHSTTLSSLTITVVHECN